MSDTPEWKGRRLGSYVLGERFPDIPEDQGRLYAAHHVDTGEPALVVMPGSGDDWNSSTPWCAETTRYTDPDALVLHPKRTDGAGPPRVHELTLGFIHLAGSLAQLDEGEDVRAHFLRAPRPIRARHQATRWGLTAMALAVGFVFLFWPRTSTPPDMRDLPDDTPILMDGQNLHSAIAYPMPEKPFEVQRKPPCMPETEVEIRGGCWVRHRRDAPCPPGTAEYQGKCYVAVKKPDPEPRSIQP
ncbi:hypothetical protein D187_004204 [Cystobacter fuscus DSM 2262]|uniref:Uncharacterized protein n=1 Tax=Cystobacter fuscus (strain ATCC 25194 / DSM 2262 / NBRC 100088 / M29) TaxID=1242864 RepID=S9P7I7_CYSF2|nr:hypothetical protein [Cystobacter fuscus]EPX58167.1 hypothetical protein D187_004204 [Cystobacter fuscus DSM 2262]